MLFAEEIFEFGDVAVFGAVAADSADLFTVMIEDDDGGDAAACAQFAAEFFVIVPLSLRHFFVAWKVDINQFHLSGEAAEVRGGKNLTCEHFAGTAPVGSGEENKNFLSEGTCF